MWKYRVDLVLQAHIHDYTRLSKFKNYVYLGKSDVNTKQYTGPVYVTNGHSGTKHFFPDKPYKGVSKLLNEKFITGSDPYYLQIELNGDTLIGSLMDPVIGTVKDTFTIYSQDSFHDPKKDDGNGEWWADNLWWVIIIAGVFIVANLVAIANVIARRLNKKDRDELLRKTRQNEPKSVTTTSSKASRGHANSLLFGRGISREYSRDVLSSLVDETGKIDERNTVSECNSKIYFTGDKIDG